jgi:hypothetical protein
MVDQNRPKHGGMPRFIPNQLQRAFVGRMAGLLTWAEMAGLILNLRTSEREERRHSPRDAARPVPDEDLPDFIFKALQMRLMTKEDLRSSAISAGYVVDGRNIHAVTVNLHCTGKIAEVAEGVYTADTELINTATAKG